jgi:hypothetical protein
MTAGAACPDSISGTISTAVAGGDAASMGGVDRSGVADGASGSPPATTVTLIGGVNGESATSRSVRLRTRNSSACTAHDASQNTAGGRA